MGPGLTVAGVPGYFDSTRPIGAGLPASAAVTCSQDGSAGSSSPLRDDDVRIGALAARLGYASESAFSTAFKREVGEAPLRYRHRLSGDGSR